MSNIFELSNISSSVKSRDDILIGSAGADYFDYGDETDVVIDFSITENDDNAGDCEEIIGTKSEIVWIIV